MNDESAPVLSFTQAQLSTVMSGEAKHRSMSRLVVRGELSARFFYLFEGMDMERIAGTTVLTGYVRDQAHLYGLIERIQELGLELLELKRVA